MKLCEHDPISEGVFAISNERSKPPNVSSWPMNLLWLAKILPIPGRRRWPERFHSVGCLIRRSGSNGGAQRDS